MRLSKIGIVACLSVLAGCADPDLVNYRQELAQPGGWNPPADILALADTFNIANVQAGPWVGPSGCGGSFLEGTRVLRDWVSDYWPQVTSIGGYSCRAIAGTNSMSVHATGRAIDIMIPIDRSKPTDDSADNDAGDPLANWLLEHAQEIGIQIIIWDNMIWSSSRSPGSRLRAYTGVHPHHDHLHVELNPDAAALKTPWFSGPKGPPDLGPCGDAIPPEGGIVDDKDACFQAYGPADFWRVVDGQGHGGSLRWTNAWQADDPSNWARWRLNVAEAGVYRVEYYSVREWAVFDSAQFRVRHDGAEEDVYVDLSAGEDGWQPLGDFAFAAGEDQWVSIYDNAPVEVGEDQHIIADAIRLLPPSAEGGASGGDAGGDGGQVDGGGPKPGSDPSMPDGADGEAMDEDGPRVIRGRGGCSTAAGVAEAPGLLVLALLGWRRRR